MIFRNFSFEYLLFLPILFWALFLLARDIRSEKKFSKKHIARMRNYKYFRNLALFKKISLGLSLVLIFISLMRPMWGVKKISEEVLGVDMIFTLDVSQSMQALDMGGGVDRLTMARQMITNYVSEHSNNRYGLIIFAGEAFVSTPLTLDHSAFISFLDNVSSRDVAHQGTNLGGALEASINRFRAKEEDERRSRVIILISDGGEEADTNIDNFLDVAREENIQIFTIGVGSKKGVPIPRGRDLFGRVTYKEHQGQIVKTKLYEKPLRDIARETGGEYFHAKNKNDLDKILHRIEDLEKNIMQREANGARDDKYQYFLFPAFLFFFIYLFLFFYKSDHKFKIFSFFKKNHKLSIIFLIFFLNACSSETMFRYYNHKGGDNFSNRYLKEARDNYTKAKDYSQTSKYISGNNQAIVDYETMKYEEARETLEENIYLHCEEQKQKYCDELYYNLGNIYYRLGEENEEERNELWQKAIASYQEALKLNQDDKQAQENIDFIQSKMAENAEDTEGDSGESAEEDLTENTEGDSTENNQGKNIENAEGEGDQNAEGAAENSDEESAQNSETANTKGSEEGEREEGESSASDSAGTEGDKEGGAQSQSPELDGATEAQIDNYLSQMEAREKKMQDYFNQNPNAKQNSRHPFDSFFGDSFFDYFFNRNNSNNFSNQENSSEIDW